MGHVYAEKNVLFTWNANFSWIALILSLKPTSKGMTRSLQEKAPGIPPKPSPGSALGSWLSSFEKHLENHYKDSTGHPASYMGATPYLVKSSSNQQKNSRKSSLPTQQWCGFMQHLIAIALKASISTQSTPTGSKFDSYFLRFLSSWAQDGWRRYTQ